MSSSFSDEDKPTVEWFRRFLAAFPDVHIVQAGKQPIPPWDEIQQLITDSDFVCAVITRRGSSSPLAIANEIGIAARERKMIIAFVEHGVQELGILRYVTSYMHFDRATLGLHAPDYLTYVYNARVIIRKQKGLDRDSIIRRLEDCIWEIKTGATEGDTPSTKGEL